MTTKNTEEKSSIQENYDDELTNQDYGFIFNKDGELKSVFFPTKVIEVPEDVLTIFRMCGIKNPIATNASVTKTLH